MKVLVIDPGLSGRRGHNGALAAEFDQEFRDSGAVQWTFAASACAVTAHFADLAATIMPAFRFDGYARLQSADVLSDARLQTLVNATVEDLARVPLEKFDGILMPTCYPLHLIALSQIAARLARKRLMVGLLMPTTFWASEAPVAARLGGRMAEALFRLQSECEVLAYSEVGSYRFGEAAIETATLLPPVSSDSMRQLCALAARDRSGAAQPVKFGFFGSPFTSKGVLLLAEAARQLDPAQFLRIHRSLIVNTHYIKELHPWAHGEFLLTLHDGTHLSSSRSYNEGVQQFLRQFGA